VNALVKKLIQFVPAVVLAGLIGYGAFSYYFKKPVPIVNNTTVQPGATLNVEQGKKDSKNFGLFLAPLFIDGKIGGMVGVEIKF